MNEASGYLEATVGLDELNARLDKPVEQIAHNLHVLLTERLGQTVRNIRVLEGPPAELSIVFFVFCSKVK